MIKKITFLSLVLSVFIVFSLFSLLSLSTIFASNEKNLSYAISKNNIKEVKKLLTKGKADLREINYFSSLPALRIGGVLLENDDDSIELNKFLELILNYDCHKWNSEKNRFELDGKLIKQKYVLAEFALKKGAKPQKINKFDMLPSIELSKLLLSHGLSPDKLYALILKHTEYNYEDYHYELINRILMLALKKGARPQQEINNFAILPSLEFSKLLLSCGLDPNKLYFLVFKHMEYSCEKSVHKHGNMLMQLALKNGANITKVNELSLAEFDPQDINFSNLNVIKTWVASKHHEAETLLNLQRYIAALVPQNKQGMVRAKVKLQVPQSKKTEYFGFSFPILAGIELLFLQHVNKISKNKKIITLEIAAAQGFVSWKVPFAFEGRGLHYVNDFSSIVLKKFNNIVSNILQKLQKPELSDFVKIIPGSCFDILSKHPDLVNKVDVIFVQNLEHFFNPIKHEKFLFLIEKLLAPGGYAFLSANSPHVYNYSNGTGRSLKLLLEKKLNGDKSISKQYPMFIQIEQQFENSEEDKILSVKRVENSGLECTVKHLTNRSGGEDSKVVIRNLFTPEIYTQAILLNTNLEIIDSFYLDDLGLRTDFISWEKYNKIGNAVIIVKKPEVNTPA